MNIRQSLDRLDWWLDRHPTAEYLLIAAVVAVCLAALMFVGTTA